VVIFVGELPEEQPFARWPVSDQAAALHEAAHACAALHAGMTVESLTMAECVALRGDATPRGLAVYALAGAAMAGRFGQVRSPSDEAILKDAVNEGVAIWRPCYPDLSDSDVRRIVHHEFKTYADKFVTDNNADIRRLACALLEHRWLNGNQCIAVLSERWRPKPARPPIKLGD